MTLSDQSGERIAFLHRVARQNGSLISTEELSHMLPESASAAEIEDALASVPLLKSRFRLQSGYVTEGLPSTPQDLMEEERNRGSARANLMHAARLIPLFHTSRFEMVSVSGSTSYGSASWSKDLDFFCVTPARRMWVSFTKG